MKQKRCSDRKRWGPRRGPPEPVLLLCWLLPLVQSQESGSSIHHLLLPSSLVSAVICLPPVPYRWCFAITTVWNCPPCGQFHTVVVRVGSDGIILSCNVIVKILLHAVRVQTV